MDRRSLLAIALTFIVLLAWQVFFIAPKRKEAEERMMQRRKEAALRDSLSVLEGEKVRGDTLLAETEPVTEGEAVAPAQPWSIKDLSQGVVEEARIVVTTEKMVVEMSSMGGEIKGVTLLDFPKKGGGLVQLVPEGAQGGLALSLREGDEWKGLSGARFEPSVNGRPAPKSVDIVLGEQQERAEVAFTLADASGKLIEKKFLFHRRGYEIGVSVSIMREGSLRRSEAYSLSWECGLEITEKDARGDRRQFASLGRVGEEFYKESISKFGKETVKVHEGMVIWAGSRTKYFLSAIIPDQQRPGTLMMMGSKGENFIGHSIGYQFRGDPRIVEDSFTCYIGPLDMNTLKGYGVGLEKTIDLGWLRFFSVFILRLMMALRRFIPNYGVIVILLSVMTKVLFYRLTHKSFKSMKDMQRLQPRIKELQEKYKENKEKLNKEMMKMYKEAGVNPLGGCLPLLLQMPVFIALFNVLRNTIELRGAPFFLWINDLSSPDVLFNFGTSLPFLGSEFHLLPILMGVAMVVQSKLGASPTGEAAPAAQTKMMSTMMPIVFTFIFYGMPSGLVLYWLVNNILSIIQQYYIHKEVEAEESISEKEESPVIEKEKPPRAVAGGKSEGVGNRSKTRRRTGGKSSKSKRRPYH